VISYIYMEMLLLHGSCVFRHLIFHSLLKHMSSPRARYIQLMQCVVCGAAYKHFQVLLVLSLSS